MAFAATVLDRKPIMHQDDEALLTSGQAAALLGVNASTLRRTPYKRLPYDLTPGGHRRYSLDAIQPFIGRDGREFRFDVLRGPKG